MILIPKRILILGAGTGGTLLANSLAHRLASKIVRGEVSVEVMAENDMHIFQPANLDIAMKGERPDKSVRKESSLLNKKVKLILDAASRIDLNGNTVTTRSGATINYDYLVIATGSVASPKGIEGLEDGSLNFHAGPEAAAKVWEVLKNFNSGNVVVAIAGLPHKCPPSPIEAAFMLDELFRKRGTRDKVSIKLVTPYARAYPAPPIADIVEPLFKERNIELTTFFNVSRVDPASHKMYSLEGEQVGYDLLIAVPPHRGADVIINSKIGDNDGWIPTDRNTLNVKGHDNAFAIGDCTDIPISKSGVVAHLESEVVMANILYSLNGSKERLAYDGRINCPMEVGGRKVVFVSATYKTPAQKQKPSTIKYMMKKAFAMMYWSTLSGNFKPVFDVFFGKTSFPLKELEAVK